LTPQKVGAAIAERAKAAGITKLRSIVPVTNTTAASRHWPMPAREGGLEF